MTELELNWAISTLASIVIIIVTVYAPLYIEHLAMNPHMVSQHKGKWFLPWVCSALFVFENSLYQIVVNTILVLVCFLVLRLCNPIKLRLRNAGWNWLPKIFFEPDLEMWDTLILGLSAWACFNFLLFSFMYSVGLYWNIDESTKHLLINCCRWLLFSACVLLWLKWVLTYHYRQIEEWIDRTW